MLNLESIRKLNRVSLHYAPQNGSVEPFFMAYLKDGYNYSIGIKTEDAFNGLQALLQSPALMAAADFALKQAGSELTAVLDLRRKMTYVGSNPSVFNIDCSLYVIDSFETDVLEPINNLKDFLLPKSSETFNTKAIFEKAYNYLEKRKTEAIKKEKTENPYYTGGFYQLSQSGLKILNEFLGNVSLMERPLQFSDDSKSVILKLPGLVVPEVFLKSVNFRVPYVTYSDRTGQPFIERVDLSIEIETMRNVSRNYMQFLK